MEKNSTVLSNRHITAGKIVLLRNQRRALVQRVEVDPKYGLQLLVGAENDFDDPNATWVTENDVISVIGN